MKATTLDQTIDRRQWFSELKAEYITAGSGSSYFHEEMKVFEERNRFSFYSGLNPLWHWTTMNAPACTCSLAGQAGRRH
jgi:hypothetical protein